eukprot:Awhi_evm1s1602
MKLTTFVIQSALTLCVFCPNNTFAAAVVECRSISSQVTDSWCQQVACVDVYKEFCQMGSKDVAMMQHLDSPYPQGHFERPMESMQHLDNPNPSGHSGKPMVQIQHLDSPYPNGHSEKSLEQGQHLD